MSNLVSLTHPNLQILNKTQMEVCSVSEILIKSLLNKSHYNSRTSNFIDMKLGQLTKPYKWNMATSKNLTMKSCWQIMKSLIFFQFMATLERSKSQILDVWSIILSFSLVTNFYPNKTGNKTKKSLTRKTNFKT